MGFAMRHLQWASLVIATRLAALARAADVVYVTDLSIYTLLAPCAATAVSNGVGAATYSTLCGEGEKDLQQCVCSSTAVSKLVSSSISSSLSYSCGPSATDDVWSASKVMELYCDQEASITFSTPTTNIVNAYITDLPQLGYLPECAQSALSQAVMGVGSGRCPEAAQLYAPCVCSKANVVSSITEMIRKSVKYTCSNNDDVTSASNFYNEYCAMNNGTTSFAPPSGPPGDMTYYITGMPQFQALRSCAQSGVSSAVMEQSAWLCGDGPQELASCICLKSGLYNSVSSTLTSGVKGYCDNTATDDVTSALSVLEYYCSAAENKVVATVSDSISQSYPVATTGIAPGSGSNSNAPAQTSNGHKADKTGTTSTDSSASSTNSDGADAEESHAIGVAPIAGGVVGALAVVALIGGIIMFMRRKRQKRGEQIPSGGEGNNNGGPDFNGKPELMGSSPGTPGVGYGKTGAYPPSSAQELSGPDYYKPRPELDGGNAMVTELPPNQVPTPELHGQSPVGYASPYGQPPQHGGYKNSQQMPQELSSPGYGFQPSPQLNGQPVYEFPAHPPPAHRPQNQQEMGWKSGPVESYELDSNMGRRQV